MEKQTEFIIDRSVWRCGGNDYKNGRGRGQTLLLNHENYQCCLGQIGEQLGYEFLLNVSEPGEIFDEEAKFKESCIIDYNGQNTQLSVDAMKINDDAYYTLPEREKLLRERFAEEGIKLKFVGKSVKYKNEP